MAKRKHSRMYWALDTCFKLFLAAAILSFALGCVALVAAAAGWADATVTERAPQLLESSWQALLASLFMGALAGIYGNIEDMANIARADHPQPIAPMPLEPRKFRVTGIDARTKLETDVIVEAPDNAAAFMAARKRGIERALDITPVET